MRFAYPDAGGTPWASAFPYNRARRCWGIISGTGCTVSSLVRLLTDFWDHNVTDGAVSARGRHGCAECHLRRLHKIGLVPQAAPSCSADTVLPSVQLGAENCRQTAHAVENSIWKCGTLQAILCPTNPTTWILPILGRRQNLSGGEAARLMSRGHWRSNRISWFWIVIPLGS